MGIFCEKKRAVSHLDGVDIVGDDHELGLLLFDE